MIHSSALSLVGNTPLVELNNIKKQIGFSGRLLAKLEGFNPAGSAKDRVALYIIEDAEKRGLLEPGAVIIEATSGNTGIGIAFVCASKGYRAQIVMPDSMSAERIQAIKAYGAQVILTPGAEGMNGAVKKAEELHKATPNSIILGQFVNKLNPQAHYENTGRELFEQTQGKIDIFVAGIGTGGTISGAGKFLKEHVNNICIVGVEPLSSPLLSGGKSGSHKIQGIGANFVPETLDTSIYNNVVCCSDEDAYACTKLLARSEGILTGISSGAALFGAIEMLKKEENKNKTAVVLFADLGDRYYSTGVFD